MLPRPNNLMTTVMPNKLKTQHMNSLLSFGMRINIKQELFYKTSNKDAATSSKRMQQPAVNLDKKHTNLQQMQFRNGSYDYLNSQCRDIQNQNKEWKGQNQKDMFQLSQNISKRKIFSDQIIQKPNLVKLNNITNMYLDQKQTFKDNSSKNQLSGLFTRQFLQDNMLENDNENKAEKIYVDMKKKIKKISKSKRLLHKTQRIQEINIEVPQNQEQKKRREMAQHHRNLMNHAFLDQEVIIDSTIFCNKLIHHRIDNDIDTDDQQMAKGIKKLQKTLQEAVEQNKNWIMEKNELMKEIKHQEGNQMQEQLNEPQEAQFC